jgi:hypothetical protein
MIKSVSFAAIAATAWFGGVTATQACPQRCGLPHVVVYQEPVAEAEVFVRPPYYVVEQGPVYDGLGVYAPPRVYAPRVATFGSRYVYGYGVYFSGGPVAVNYPYVKRHRRTPPLRVYD